MPLNLPEYKLVLNSDIRHRSEPFGGVLFDLESKSFHPLNRSGYRLYEAITAGVPRAQLLSTVRAQLAGRADELSADGVLDGFVSRLHMADILLEDSDPTRRLTEREITAASGGTARPLALSAPLFVSLSVIFTCNLHCTHCYVGSTAERKAGSMTYRQACDLLSQMAAMHVFDVVITGGEATLMPELPELLRYGKSLGLYLNLNTNATTMSDRRAAELADTGVDCVKVSIDSTRADVHDAFRGAPNALGRSWSGIEAMVAAGLRVDVHCTLSAESTSTPEGVDRLLETAREHGVTRVHFGRVFSTGRATDQLKAPTPTLDETVEHIYDLKRSWPELVGRLPPKTTFAAPDMPSYDGCGNCGRGVYAYISYDAGMYPCTNLYKDEWQLADLREQSLREAWVCAPRIAELRTRLSPTQGPIG